MLDGLPLPVDIPRTFEYEAVADERSVTVGLTAMGGIVTGKTFGLPMKSITKNGIVHV